MRITNATPLLVAPVASRHPQTNRTAMTVALKGSFRLADGLGVAPLEEPLPLSGDVFRDDDPAGECLAASDFAWWKPRADLLLRGTCHVPEGKPVGVCGVRFAVGKWSKTLAVYGPRNWQSSGDSVGLAGPFTTFPLSYRASFGGPGRPENPVGVGFGGEILPRIEGAQAAMKSRTDTPPPAGFGPLNPTWLPRRGKLGTYTDGYRKERWPGFPTDFDWSFFNAAPEDQQVPFLEGDEILVLENLRPGLARLRSRLPGWRIRCVVQQLAGNDARIQELPMVLDTLVVDADEATVALTWRGIMEVQDEEMDDVLEIFVMAESLEERARPMHAMLDYLSPTAPLVAAALALRPTEAAAGAASAARASQGARGTDTPGAAAAGAPRAGTAGPPPGGAAPDAATPAAATPGSVPPEPAAGGPPGAPAADMPPPLALKPPVAELMSAHGAELEQARQAAVDAVDRLQEQLALHPDKLPWPGFPDAPAPPATTLHDQMVENWRAGRAAGLPDDPAGEALMSMRPYHEIIDAAQDVAKAQAQPPAAPPPPTIQEIRRRLAEPDGATAQDLSGAQLAGENLSGANLAGSVARKTDLAGLQGDNAVLTSVVFADSDLKGASLRGADLSGADLTGCDLTGADLSGANLKWATFSGACLRGARLDGAGAEYAIFTGADLTDASLQKTNLAHADLSDSCVDGVRAGKANLTEATLHGCHGTRADFSGADLTRLRAGERAQLTRCRFTKTKGAGASWQAADLSGSDFSGCQMPGALFDKALLAESRFDGSDLAGARFRKAVLRKATLKRVNLFRGSLARADVTEADFSSANLFGVDFMEATLRNTLFAGTNLKMTTLADA